MARVSGNGLFDALKTVAAAVPLLLLALAYGLARVSGEAAFGIESSWLRKLLLLELLSIHSFPFIALLGAWRPAAAEIRGLKWLATAGLAFLYLHFIHDFAGWPGLLAFASLCGVTYLGFLLHWTSADGAARLGIRWMVNFSVFAGVAMCVSLPGDVRLWEDTPPALTVGAWYFGLTAAIELTGFYQLPAWESLGRDLKQSLAEAFAPPRDDTSSPLATFRRAVVPLTGTLLCAFGPLFAAAFATSAAGHLIKNRFEWPNDDFLMQFWLPVIMTGILLVARTCQIVWIANGLAPGSDRPWWRRPVVLGSVAVVAVLYLFAASDFRGDATAVANYRAFVPRITYASYLGSESLLALVLVPLTWRTIALSLRRARTAAPAR